MWPALISDSGEHNTDWELGPSPSNACPYLIRRNRPSEVLLHISGNPNKSGLDRTKRRCRFRYHVSTALNIRLSLALIFWVMTRRSTLAILSLAGVAIFSLLYVHGCEHEENASVTFSPPLGNVEFHSFWVFEWVTSPSQEITIRLQQQSDLKQLIDLRVFGDFRSDMSDKEVLARFGEPSQTRTDTFGGTWSRYTTALGYVEIGVDRRTSPTDDDDDKSPVPGRRSLQAFTDKPLNAIFRAPLLDVMRQATTMSPRADERELSVFDSKHGLILVMWMKGGRIERMELFKPVDR
jgi:hypothetical protein